MPNLSIFNDVLGPVMVGPSSSHTAGPARLGLWARHLFGRAPGQVTATFDPGGSLACTYRGQRADRGFTAGFLGLAQDDERLRDSPALAAAAGLAVQFRVAPLMDPAHPNDAELRLADGAAVLVVRGASVGGGMIRVTAVDGTPVNLTGDTHVLAVWWDHGPGAAADPAAGARLREFLDGAGVPLLRQHPGNPWVAELGAPLPAGASGAAGALPGVRRVAVAPPVLPVPARPGVAPLFRSAADLAGWAGARGTGLAGAALAAEAHRAGWTEAQAGARMEQILQAMERAVDRGLAGDPGLAGGLARPAAARLEAARRGGGLLSGAPVGAGVAAAVATMEYANAMGVVVAAPTAGSCGVLPGVLRAMAAERGAGREVLLRGLWAAGAVGLVVARRATFAAEVGGCQAECGVSSAMAAAALVEMAGGGPDLALGAAAVALQNTLGLICDPIACRVEVPCISRNAMAVGNAFASADLVLGGHDPLVPFDEMVDAMAAVAQEMPAAHRCTGLGGVAATPTAVRLARELEG